MAAKVLILTGDAGESLEVLYPYQRLREEGYEVHIAAPSKKKLQLVVTTSSRATTPTRRSRATPGRRTSPSARSIRPSTPRW